jgi:methyltransferase (TIGR00027 family)
MSPARHAAQLGPLGSSCKDCRGGKVSERRIEITTSRTAEWTCVSRAASSLESRSHYRSDDQIALLLVPTFLRLLLHIPVVRQFYSQVMAPQGIYEYTIARTKYVDMVFKEALAKGLDQILIFGAGFDTRALRLRSEDSDTRIFELDTSITQRAKLKQYEKRGVSIPSNVRFISIDFDKDSLVERLREARFEIGERSLFVLEGLLMYLQPESVDETFKMIARLAGEGSEVVFDYVQGSVLRQEGKYYGEREIMRTVEKAGECWYFGIEEGEVGQFLEKYGLRLVEQKGAQGLEQMYFTDESGEVVGRINGTHCLVRAVKASRE